MTWLVSLFQCRCLQLAAHSSGIGEPCPSVLRLDTAEERWNARGRSGAGAWIRRRFGSSAGSWFKRIGAPAEHQSNTKTASVLPLLLAVSWLVSSMFHVERTGTHLVD